MWMFGRIYFFSISGVVWVFYKTISRNGDKDKSAQFVIIDLRWKLFIGIEFCWILVVKVKLLWFFLK